MRNEDVIAKLRSVSGGGYPVKLVIARLIREEENPEDVHISDVHVSGEIYGIHFASVTWGRSVGRERGGRGENFDIIFSLSPFSLPMMRLRSLRLRFSRELVGV
jgi:hypothetical protein